MIPPIETTWNGRRYRSRTEARWAVLLTVSGVEFEYEKEGYRLPSGWYLPDFWLKEQGVWLEIKGIDPTPKELALAAELRSATGRPIWIAVGMPDGVTEKVLTVIGEDIDEILIHLELPLTEKAYRRAISERFDGKPSENVTAKMRSARGY